MGFENSDFLDIIQGQAEAFNSPEAVEARRQAAQDELDRLKAEAIIQKESSLIANLAARANDASQQGLTEASVVVRAYDEIGVAAYDAVAPLAVAHYRAAGFDASFVKSDNSREEFYWGPKETYERRLIVTPATVHTYEFTLDWSAE